MKLKWTARFKNAKGFTLVELLIVIAILGILAGIAIPSFSGQIETAKVKADEASRTAIGNAVRLYYAAEGEWPGGLTAGGPAVALIEDNDLYDDLLGYLEKNPMPQEDGYNYFTVRIDSDGKVEVGKGPTP